MYEFHSLYQRRKEREGKEMNRIKGKEDRG
jgi:hypothetical protein